MSNTAIDTNLNSVPSGMSPISSVKELSLFNGSRNDITQVPGPSGEDDHYLKNLVK